MGKGDKKTRRGKLFQGSFGVRRRRKSEKSLMAGVQAKASPVEPVPAAPEDKKSKASPAARKESKTKKSGDQVA
jgi:ribosomal small subunit protein bTHX